MIQKFQEYLNSRLLLLRLEVSERISKTLAAFLRRIVLLMLFVLFLVFGGIALSLYLGDILDNEIYGFLAVSGGFLVLFFLFLVLSKPLMEKPFMNQVIKILFEKRNEQEKDTGQQS
ncbi:MAG: hypothetical protein K9I68_10835 [Bacteroidales bacterium]|nr:hypothetical protein [Bacteroidales bacterium]MCF8336799.1 hypothetical protein [Bacteroidales bacterium]